MHQAGGSAGRKKDALRCSVVRQRGAAILARDINSWVSAKTSHRRTVPSLDPVTTRWPSGLNAALITRSGWPKRAIEPWVLASHSRTVLSQDAVTIRLPSELNAAPLTTPV